jgi:hypothetical protein
VRVNFEDNTISPRSSSGAELLLYLFQPLHQQIEDFLDPSYSTIEDRKISFGTRATRRRRSPCGHILCSLPRQIADTPRPRFKAGDMQRPVFVLRDAKRNLPVAFFQNSQLKKSLDGTLWECLDCVRINFCRDASAQQFHGNDEPELAPDLFHASFEPFERTVAHAYDVSSTKTRESTNTEAAIHQSANGLNLVIRNRSRAIGEAHDVRQAWRA